MKTFLHVGCGPQDKTNIHGFNNDNWKEIRFDIDKNVNPDIVGTLTDMKLVKTNSVDAIYSSHNIEHVFPHEVPIVLKEFHRVLKDDGSIIAPALAADVKPFIHVQLGRCLFDMESGKEVLAELNKNPDMKKSKIAFSYSTVKNPSYQPGLHLGVREEELNIPPKKTAAPNAYNPAADVSGAEPAEEGKKSSPLGDKAKSKMAKLKDRATGVVSQATNITDGIGMGGSLGNAHGALLGGPLANAANSAVENVTGKLFLDNVYGVNPLGTVQDAINAGSINGLINAAGQAAKGIKSLLKPKGGTSISPDKVYGAAAPDSNSPINESVYDNTAPDNDDLGKSSVYDKTPGGDSTLTKENVYGNTAPDNDDLGKSSVYDKPAANNDTLTKDNVYE